jgi:hypothetical protein
MRMLIKYMNSFTAIVADAYVPSRLFSARLLYFKTDDYFYLGDNCFPSSARDALATHYKCGASNLPSNLFLSPPGLVTVPFLSATLSHRLGAELEMEYWRIIGWWAGMALLSSAEVARYASVTHLLGIGTYQFYRSLPTSVELQQFAKHDLVHSLSKRQNIVQTTPPVPTWATILLIVGILVICAVGISYVIIVGKRRRAERAAKENESSEKKGKEKDVTDMPIQPPQPAYSQYSRELALGLM